MERELCGVVIPEGVNIGACVSKESLRYAIRSVLIEQHGDRALAFATDGRTLSATVLDSAAPGNWSGLVSPKILPRASDKGVTRRLTLNGDISRCTKDGTTIRAEPEEGIFPPHAAVMPNPSPDTHTCVGLNAEYFANAVAAVSTDGIIRIFIDKKSGRPLTIVGDRGMAAVCPINTNESAWDDARDMRARIYPA